MTDDEIKEFLNDIQNIKSLMPNGIQLDAVLNKGGQGIVYRGTVSGQEAAIKVYFPGQIETRIQREINALSKLNNPHIVKLISSGFLAIDEQRLPVVATEYVAGQDLEKYIQTNGPLDRNTVGQLVYDISDAINTMWSTNERIVHRDLKPPNILMRESNGRVCVIDLGIGRHMTQTPLTATGYTWGTQGYMSPEQCAGSASLTCKSDVYALGVVALECLLGKHPTRRDQTNLFLIQNEESLPDQVKDWEFADILGRMLSIRAVARPLPQEIMRRFSKFSSVGV